MNAMFLYYLYGIFEIQFNNNTSNNYIEYELR
jgi:hypothetical protein